LNFSADCGLRSGRALELSDVYPFTREPADSGSVERFSRNGQETWPNFFIVGAPKAGTTSLYAYLAQHPQVFMPAMKEPQFFAQIHPTAEFEHLVDAIRDRRRYLRLYRGAAGFRAIGEASPSYLWHPEVPARIKRVAPEAKIIIALRDPIERAQSHHLEDYREGAENLRFCAALRSDLARPRKGLGVSHMYVELGLYAEQVGRYLDVFGPYRVHVLLFDALERSARGVLASVCRFLDLDTAAAESIDTSRVYNGFAVPRSEWTRRICGQRWARHVWQTVFPRRLGTLIFDRLFNRPGPRPPIDRCAKELLRPIYEPDIRKLESLLGRALPELQRTW
jgi:Sulfotransferase domain